MASATRSQTRVTVSAHCPSDDEDDINAIERLPSLADLLLQQVQQPTLPPPPQTPSTALRQSFLDLHDQIIAAHKSGNPATVHALLKTLAQTSGGKRV